MRARILVFLGFVTFPAVCISQVRPRPAGQPPSPPAFMQQLKSFEQEGAVTKVVLKNDLTILVVEAHSYPLAEVLAWVKVGTMDDPSETKGISRLMEHMLSRGTTNRTASVFAADMKALGGELHSATEYDHTGFWTIVPSAQWQKAVEIQADALLNPLLDPQELKRQIGVMGYESQQEAEDPETSPTSNSWPRDLPASAWGVIDCCRQKPWALLHGRSSLLSTSPPICQAECCWWSVGTSWPPTF